MFSRQRALRYAKIRPRGIAVHVLHALNNKGHNQVLIQTVDTDTVVVITIGLFNELLSLHPSANVWISLGMGKHFQLRSVNAICASYLFLMHLEQCPCFIPFPSNSSLLEASKACLELLKCGCKQGVLAGVNAPKPIYLVQAYINVLQFLSYMDMFFNYNTLKCI